MVKCRITVLIRTFHEDLVNEYVEMDMNKCSAFNDGQEFVAISPTTMPEAFPCPWAWNDIHKAVLTLMHGGNFKKYVGKTGKIWNLMKTDNTFITCCTDGIRPVIFKLEVFDRQ